MNRNKINKYLCLSILMKDKDYIKKSINSICKNCKNKIEWEYIYFTCKIDNPTVRIERDYEGFSCKVIDCENYEPE